MSHVKKPAIPSPPIGDRFSQAVKENIEIITGRRSTPVVAFPDTVPSTASTADLIVRVNEITDKMNAIIRAMQ
ncbi:MAG TPA: hypothetical protein VMW24_10990 [Sedimentisphaerales bacterium]|nr:hypothetical protein [Sedimentisphaerales bacterium]